MQFIYTIVLDLPYDEVECCIEFPDEALEFNLELDEVTWELRSWNSVDYAGRQPRREIVEDFIHFEIADILAMAKDQWREENP